MPGSSPLKYSNPEVRSEQLLTIQQKSSSIIKEMLHNSGVMLKECIKRNNMNNFISII